MSIALAPTTGAGALGGVVFGEGYAGKVPELVTPSYAASGALVGWADTAVPTCVMYNAVRVAACVRAWMCADWEGNGALNDAPRCVCVLLRRIITRCWPRSARCPTPPQTPRVRPTRTTLRSHALER
jgi:hypothetical protein